MPHMWMPVAIVAHVFRSRNTRSDQAEKYQAADKAKHSDTGLHPYTTAVYHRTRLFALPYCD